MAELQVGTFTSWTLTEEEEIQGSIFTITQLQVLQNLLSVNAEEKIGLKFTPETPDLYAQEEGYKRGQIELLRYLIDNSEAKVQLLNDMSNPDFEPPTPPLNI